MQDRSAHPISRRSFAALGVGALAGIGAGVERAHGQVRSEPLEANGPDLDFLRSTPLANAERLRFHMKERGLDALVVSHPANIFYLSNHWPQLDRMGFDDTSLAIFSADPSRPLALVMHAFLYYYTHSPESAFEDRVIFPYTQPAGGSVEQNGEPPAQPMRMMRIADDALVTDRERHRRRMFDLTRPASAGPGFALRKALQHLGLTRGRLGFDEPAVEVALRRHGFEGDTEPAENVIRRARLTKSDAELRLMRIAAQSNVDAALEAAAKARELGSSRALRNAFYGAAGRRGNIGRFMIVQGSSAEVLDEPLRDGTSVSIDCVSACRHYHGDFGRTIFIGEPNAAIRRAGEAIYTAWGEIKSQLRPGMAFSDIPRIGRETLAALGVAELVVSFNPHSVGLFHTDHPQPSLLEPRTPETLMLEAGMILSVDCPLFVSGMGGTFHFENLMLITPDGAEAIHTDPPPVLIV
ncbi:MAG: M24 family metallopeptidase [Parvularcula sp.]|jgi:Xaa-Pro aminopeptidase|nr:M24 family metallopeptidase [Parvularcula sp.]